VDLNETGKTVKEINQALLAKGIFGGKDLSEEFPAFGQCALYCVTEVHLKKDLDRLAQALREIIEA
jgi:glycine dehydrogenase subunit 1